MTFILRRTTPVLLGTALLMALLASCSKPPAPAAEQPQIPAPPDVAAPPPDSLKAASGISTRVLQPGTGQRHPRATDTVSVHYTGWTTDGKMFDSSVQRGQPSEFRLNGVIRGWTEGVQMMVEGEKRRLWIPESLAYQGQPGQPQGMLVFDIELLDIK
jgi:FKBP-type peptidyl-prolyl cis-trans isomerase